MVNDYEKLQDIFGQLLREIQRITSEGDFEAGKKSNIEILSQPRWPLDEKAPFMKGAGLIL